jgi:hypothetical protein
MPDRACYRVPTPTGEDGLSSTDGGFVPQHLKLRGASGGTRTPSASLYVRLPAALDIDLRTFCAAHESRSRRWSAGPLEHHHRVLVLLDVR